jgi:hypothetical protein
MNIIAEIFEKMDNWRNLPKYQLERRADIFFAVYLKAALEVKYNIKIKEEIIPEFPIHKATIDPNNQTNQSVNVDFLALDLGSRRKSQDDYLIAAANKGLAKLIQGLVEIFRVTKLKKKYFHLFKILADAGIIELPSQLQPRVFSKNMSGVGALIRKVKIIAPVEQSKVVYIQPTGDGENVITFNEFGSLIEGIDDPITQRFVESLKTWSEIKAGDINA